MEPFKSTLFELLFERSFSESNIFSKLISYKDSPYTFSPNKEDVASSVVKINVTNKHGQELQLTDPDDPITMSIDTSSVFEDESTWKDMDEFKSVEGAFMLVAAFNYSVNAIIIEIRIKTLKVCTIYGKYGYSEPSEEDNDITVITKGLNKIKTMDPDTLNIDFQDQVFRLTLINENASEVMEPLVMTILCEARLFNTLQINKNEKVNNHKQNKITFNLRVCYFVQDYKLGSCKYTHNKK
ncbi:hypothetical protein KUTeg_023079 [Tegillarca granosa]|uniref:Uncharacterized protein n=1 Tax=Tegillarca granosa TaxID=220873 RepID=A0ABQ9E105_TEGGR|nr:hypothetical protein KUTeg_023079 [Tegillarca granosa]